MRACVRITPSESSFMANTKPVIVTLEYPPDKGGIARYLGELVRASGEQVDVVVPMGLGLSGPGNVSAKEMFRTGWPRWWPLVSICKGLKDHASVLIVSHVLPVGTAAMISKWFGGPPYVLILHGLDVKLAARNVWKRFLTRLILRSAKRIFVNSEATAHVLWKLFGNTRAIVVTPGVVIGSLPSREDARRRLGISADEHVILAVSRFVERKGIDALLEASKQLPTHDRIRIVVIGAGPEEQALRTAAREIPHTVQIYTNVSDEYRNEWYAAANVFCLPVKENDEDMEGFGIVFLEAAAAGLPVIAGKTGGAVEAVADRETGILVDPNDVRAIAQTLLILLGDREKQKEMGNAGRERAMRSFRWEDRWKKMIESI